MKERPSLKVNEPSAGGRGPQPSSSTSSRGPISPAPSAAATWAPAAAAVQVDGKPRLACLTLAWQVEGKEITTVEGLASPDGKLHPLQKAFAECGGSQCGFCTPGFLMNGAAFLKDHPTFTDAELREAVSGNLCRCTGYLPIFDSFRQAAKEMAK